ncbi:MAG: 50S ribosomal protein L6 [Candidatus Omnitrophica bacterium]|nr:50S ribosomal protein L6 [Candidatus Omnitrophota bacterium]
MSRVGKKVIEVPAAVKVEIIGRQVKIESKGKKIEHLIPEGFKAELKDKSLCIIRPADDRESRSLHGTTRSLLNNIFIGLKDGFQKKLELHGVGYRVQMKGKNLSLEIGKTHPVIYNTPEGITIETPTQTEIVIKGIDKQLVGHVAAEIRGIYPPEPYKGKGIKYSGEVIRRKQGKSIA